MHDALGNLLALVAQGQLTRAEARAVAANKWVSGAGVPAADLPVFDAELIKLTEEMRMGTYAARVAKRAWPEIEQILKSPHLDFATKQEIRNHPDTLRARQAFKLATFGQFKLGAQALTYRALAKRMTFTGYSSAREKFTFETARHLRAEWLKQWPEVATWLRTVDPARPGCDESVVAGPFRFEVKEYTDPADVTRDFGPLFGCLHEFGGKAMPPRIMSVAVDPKAPASQRRRRGTVARASTTTRKKPGKRARSK